MKLFTLAAHPEADVWPLPGLLLLLVLEAGGSKDNPGCGLEPLSLLGLRFLTMCSSRSVETTCLKGIIAAEAHGNPRGHLESFSDKQEWEQSPSCQFQHRVSKEHARDSAFVISE